MQNEIERLMEEIESNIEKHPIIIEARLCHERRKLR